VDTLVLEIMNGIHDPLIVHAHTLIDLPKQNGYESCLPVMTVDDTGAPARSIKELDGSFAEKRKAHGVIVASVEYTPVEEIVVRMGFDKVAFSAVDTSKKDRAMYTAPEPGHPQVVVGDVHPTYLVIPETVVFGEYDLYIISANFKFTAQTNNHIGQAAHFSDGCQFRRNMNNVHGPGNFRFSWSAKSAIKYPVKIVSIERLMQY
jgi:hypothetical protein